MSLSNTEYGKAYEYACLLSLQDYLSGKTAGTVHIEISDAYHTACAAFAKARQEGVSGNLIMAANAAVRVITRLEPQLQFGNGALSLCI